MRTPWLWYFIRSSRRWAETQATTFHTVIVILLTLASSFCHGRLWSDEMCVLFPGTQLTWWLAL